MDDQLQSTTNLYEVANSPSAMQYCDYVRTHESSYFGGLTNEEILIRKGYIHPQSNGTYNIILAADIAFNPYPQRNHPGLEIQIIDGQDLKIFSGPISNMINDATQHIANSVHSNESLDTDMLSDLLANAVVHRSYAEEHTGTPIQVSLSPTESAVKIVNPGGFKPPVSPTNIGTKPIISVRNHYLMAICLGLELSPGKHIARRSGRTVYEMYKNLDGNVHIAYQDDGYASSVTLQYTANTKIKDKNEYASEFTTSIYSKEQKVNDVLKVIKDSPSPVSIRMILNSLGLEIDKNNKQRIRRYLNDLVSEGQVYQGIDGITLMFSNTPFSNPSKNLFDEEDNNIKSVTLSHTPSRSVSSAVEERKEERRQTIIQTLEEAGSTPLSASDIVNKVRPLLNISEMTVFRAINDLLSQGVIEDIAPDASRTRAYVLRQA